MNKNKPHSHKAHEWSVLIIALLITCMPFLLSAGTENLEIIHIPAEDFSKAPGHSDKGVYLPLSEILDLAEKASREKNTEYNKLGLYCKSIQLNGILKNALELEGSLEYSAPSEGWSATLISEENFPWTFQEAPEKTDAFLTKINGKSYLYAKGPGSGKIKLNAVFRVEFIKNTAVLKIPAFIAPCRMDIKSGDGIRIVSGNKYVLENKTGEKETVFSIFPSVKEEIKLTLEKEIPSEIPDSPILSINRSITNVGAGIRITDEIILKKKFSKDEKISLNIPKNLNLLRTESLSPLKIKEGKDKLDISISEKCGIISFSTISSINVTDGKALPGSWDIPCISVKSKLSFIPSGDYTPLPSEFPSSLIPISTQNNTRTYECWGKLPEIEIALVKKAQQIPADIVSFIKILRNQSQLGYRVKLKRINKTDPESYSTNEINFITPEDWVLTSVQVKRERNPVSYSIFQKNRTRWRINTEDQSGFDYIFITIHKSGAWGSPGTTADLDIPVIKMNEIHPESWDYAIGWQEGINVRTHDLSNIYLKTEEGKPRIDKTSDLQIKLQVAGKSHKGQLSITGQESDIKATIVSSLSIGEKDTLIKTLIRYVVKTASTNKFHFIVPPEITKDIRISGKGIREKTRKKTGTGEEWTITTHNEILGPFDLIIEWQEESDKENRSVIAPEIEIPDVTSQQGFIILNGSESLRLTAETTNLREADIDELPSLPWKSDKRTLAVYRYIAPPFLLKVDTEKFESEKAVSGLVKEADFTTTLSPEGIRLTKANYKFTKIGARQFFDIQLPEKSEAWSVRVNNKGIKPSYRIGNDGAKILMAPLASGNQKSPDTDISIFYVERNQSLNKQSRLRMSAPNLSVPILNTSWKINLPPGFEYLSYGGEHEKITVAREPVITFLRKAYYPGKIIFENISTAVIIILTLIIFCVSVIVRLSYRTKIKGKQKTSEEKKKKKQRKTFHFTLLEIIIVFAIIAILSAISVPNFLEAQVRSKVSRVKSDARSLATGIESYFVDNNAYPHKMDILSQGAVKYMSGQFTDPYSPYRGTPLKYLTGEKAAESAIKGGYATRENVHPDSIWIVYSIGPDTIDDEATIIYDPTNGTVSRGDIIRTNHWYPPTHTTSYKSIKDKQKKRRKSAGKKTQTLALSSVKEIPSINSNVRVLAESGVTPQAIMPAERDEPQEDTDVNAFAAQNNQGITFKSEYIPSHVYRASRIAGIQSMDIEIPAGGIQRKFTYPGNETGLNISYMEENNFLAFKFIVKMLLFMLLSLTWIIKRKYYKAVLIISAGVSLFVPIIINTEYVAFFNAAFQGILISLITPLLSAVYNHITGNKIVNAKIPVIIAILIFSLGNSKVTATTTTVSNNPIRIVVPYNDNLPIAEEDPLAFISRDSFEYLWKKASDISPVKKEDHFIISNLSIKGTLLPEDSKIQGELTLHIYNIGNTPSEIPLELGKINIAPVKTSVSGAFIESTDKGLVLHVEKHWSGKISAPFTLPCNIKGSSGSFKLAIPEAAAGEWKFNFPYVDMDAETADHKPFIIYRHPDKTEIYGNTVKGELELSWKMKSSSRKEKISGISETDIKSTIIISSLSSANHYSTVRFTAPGSMGNLPGEVRISKNPDLKIISAHGEDLNKTTVTDKEIIFQLNKTHETEISITAIQVPSSTVDSDKNYKSWNIHGFRAPEQSKSYTDVKIAVSERIKILSVKPENLERYTAKSGRGFSVQRYTTNSDKWRIHYKLQAPKPNFSAEISEAIALSKGLLHRIISIKLEAKENSLSECVVNIPPGIHISDITCDEMQSWVKNEQNLVLSFNKSVSKVIQIFIYASSKTISSSGEIEIRPTGILNASSLNNTVSIHVSPETSFSEIDTGNASPITPGNTEKSLVHHFYEISFDKESSIRSYKLSSLDPMKFKVSPVKATAFLTVHNLVNVSDGLQRLRSVITATPRRGQLHEVSAVLLLTKPDPKAPFRITAKGSHTDLRREKISDLEWKITAEFISSHSNKLSVEFNLEQPIDTSDGKEITPTIFIPAEKAGSRTILLMRKNFDGELSVKDIRDSWEIDPSITGNSVPGESPLPADKYYEIPSNTKTILIPNCVALLIPS